MVIMCPCGVVLRFYNIPGTGERLAYGHRLIDEVLQDPSCPDSVFVLYDIGCVFKKYLRARMGTEYDRLTFGIGIFHVYAHEYACQVKYSPRFLEGIGWKDGEVCERLWSSLRHEIPANRSSSSYARLQNLTHGAIELGEARFLATSKSICQSFANAFVIEMEAEATLEILQKEGISEEYIEDQLQRMRDYFSSRQSAFSVDINDDIFATIRALRNARVYLDVLTRKGTVDARTVETSIKFLGSGRINAEWTANSLVTKIDHLLVKSGDTWDLWEGVNGEPGPLYLEYQNKSALSDIRKCKQVIWEEGFKRILESANLHGSLSGITCAPQY